MIDTVALAVPGGPRFVDELRRAWDTGAAVAPLDMRPAATSLTDQISLLDPTVIVDETTTTRRLEGRPAQPGDALVVATSGTSGEPRAAVLTHHALQASADATSEWLTVDPDSDRWLACLPLAHVGGLGVVTRAILTGTPLEVHDGFAADDVMAAAAGGATLVSLVPAVLDRIDTKAFRRILLGGSAIPADRPANAVATYGMTETGGGVIYDGEPLAGVEVRAVDGELQLRCPMLLRAYRDGIDPRTPDGWYRTGDAGTVSGGIVTVHGRLDEVIVTGGEKVWPHRVEAVLAEHPAVHEVAVVGRPDATWGEAVTALVVAADPAAPPGLDQLRDHARQALPAWCAPRRLELVGALPRTALGKLRRRSIR